MKSTILLTILGLLFSGQVQAQDTFETFPEKMLLAEAFFDGANWDAKAPSIEDCLTVIEDNTVDPTNALLDLIAANSTYYTWDVITLSFTELISTTYVEIYLQCGYTGVETYEWFVAYINQFEDAGAYFQAFLSNILGNVFTINELYEDFVQAEENDDTMEIIRLSGVCLDMIIDFGPVTTGTLETQPTYFSQAPSSQINEKQKFMLTQDPVHWFDAVYAFMYGLISVTFGGESEYTEECLNEALTYETIYYAVQDSIAAADGEDFIDQTSLFIVQIDPLFEDCFQVGYDYWAQLQDYFQMDDFWQLIYNIFYNLGAVYAISEDLHYYLQNAATPLQVSDYQSTGEQIGYIINECVRLHDDIDYGVPQLVYPDGMEYQHGNCWIDDYKFDDKWRREVITYPECVQ